MDAKFLYTRIRIFQPPKLKILIKAYKKKRSGPDPSRSLPGCARVVQGSPGIPKSMLFARFAVALPSLVSEI